MHTCIQIALANLGELTSGILMMCQLENQKCLKGIPVRIAMEYYKKARGSLISKCSGNIKSIKSNCDNDVITLIYNSKEEIVAKCTVTWSMKVNKV